MSTDLEFTAAVMCHHDALHRHCVRLLRSRTDGEDALQETLLRAWRSRRTLSSSSPRAWLYRIATNACMDVLARRDATLVGLDAATEPPGDQLDAAVLDHEALELVLLTAIQHLPARQQAAFMLRDVLDWSASDTASALSTTVPAANSALQRARHGLRARLGADRADWSCPAPCAAQRRVLARYLSVVEA